MLPFDSCLFFGIIKKREKTDLLELPDHHSKSSGSINVTLKCPEAGFYAILSAPVNEIRANAKGDLDKLTRPLLLTYYNFQASFLPLFFSFLSISGPVRALAATGHSIRRLWSENQVISLLHGENTHETSLFIVLVT